LICDYLGKNPNEQQNPLDKIICAKTWKNGNVGFDCSILSYRRNSEEINPPYVDKRGTISICNSRKMPVLTSAISYMKSDFDCKWAIAALARLLLLHEGVEKKYNYPLYIPHHCCPKIIAKDFLHLTISVL